MAFMAPRIEEYTTFAVSSFVHMNELVQVVTANVGGVDIGSGVESAPCVFDILVGEVLALFLWLLEFVAGGVGTIHSRGVVRHWRALHQPRGRFNGGPLVEQPFSWEAP